MKLFPALLFGALAALPGPLRAEEPAPAKPAPAAPPSLRSLVDSLSPEDLKQLLPMLKEHYIKPEAFNPDELERATLQGLIERLGPGATLLPEKAPGASDASPSKAEWIEPQTIYFRLGSLSASSLEQLDHALDNLLPKNPGAFILDLRATPPGSEFEPAAEVCRRFCPKGKVLFTVKRPAIKEEKLFTSKTDPRFSGVLVVLIDRDAAGASEVIASVLRTQAKAMVIGQNSRGEAVEFAHLPLPGGKLLRVAVAEVTLPDNSPVFPGGVKPDLAVEVPPETTAAVLKEGLEKSVTTLIAEEARSRMNEAALVAGKTPELDAMQAAQARKGEKPLPPPLKDAVLQRAVDFVTALGFYEKHASAGQK